MPLSALVVGYDPVGSGIFGNPDSPTYEVGFNQVANGVNLNGEVMIEVFNGTFAATCTGSLLSDGVSILTAAHCLDPLAGPPSLVQVYFDQGGNCGWYCGAYTVTNPADFFVDSGYIADDGEIGAGNDLAVIRLGSQAPASATRYSLYTGDSVDSIGDSLTDPIEVAGLGESGQGSDQGGTYPAGTLRQGEFLYSGSCADVSVEATGACATNSSSIAIAPFDPNSQLPDQVAIAPGDSGGGSFFNGQLVGVHEYVACNLSDCSITGGYASGDTFVGGANAAWIESVEADVPEPAPATFLALGLAAGLLLRRRRGARPVTLSVPIRTVIRRVAMLLSE